MTVDILTGTVASGRQILHKALWLRPAPVVRPYMNVAVIHIFVTAYSLVCLIVAFASPCSLATYRYKVVLVELAYEL